MTCTRHLMGFSSKRARNDNRVLETRFSPGTTGRGLRRQALPRSPSGERRSGQPGYFLRWTKRPMDRAASTAPSSTTTRVLIRHSSAKATLAIRCFLKTRRADAHPEYGGRKAWVAFSFSQPAGLELLDG